MQWTKPCSSLTWAIITSRGCTKNTIIILFPGQNSHVLLPRVYKGAFDWASADFSGLHRVELSGGSAIERFQCSLLEFVESPRPRNACSSHSCPQNSFLQFPAPCAPGNRKALCSFWLRACAICNPVLMAGIYRANPPLHSVEAVELGGVHCFVMRPIEQVH